MEERVMLIRTVLVAGVVFAFATACTSATSSSAPTSSAGGSSWPASPAPSVAASLAGVPAGFSMLPPADFSGEDRVAAFTALHERVATDYAFTDWKGLDLDALYDRTLPLVQAAAKANDAQAYLLALRSYAAAFEDGHVRVAEATDGQPLTTALAREQTGGSIGVSLLRLDDGRVVVAAVAPRSPARQAGVKAGDVVTAWNGQPIDAAVQAVNVATIVDAPAIATSEYREREQVRLLSRVPIGTTVDVTIEGRKRPLSLTAVDDDGAGLHRVDVAHPLTPEQEKSFLPQVRTLDGGIGYIQLGWLADLSNLAEYPQAIADAMSEAVEQFIDAPGIVIDLRANHGGTDQLAADICGHFVDEQQFYERTQFFNATDGTWVTLTVDMITGKAIDATYVNPQSVRYAGPVAVLVNGRTVSSGEGVAQCISALPQGVAVGIGGTRASYGIANGEIPMPDGLVFHYPNGRSVDAHGVVQLDSRAGVGGVQPERRVPVTMNTALALGRGEDVELESALRALRPSP